MGMVITKRAIIVDDYLSGPKYEYASKPSQSPFVLIFATPHSLFAF